MAEAVRHAACFSSRTVANDPRTDRGVWDDSPRDETERGGITCIAEP